jgi:hypothetical protein
MKTNFQIAGKWVVTAVALVWIVSVPGAKACSSPVVVGRFVDSRGLAPVLESSLERVLPRVQQAIAGSQDGKGDSEAIIGTWVTTFYVGTSTVLYGHGIEQFYR